MNSMINFEVLFKDNTHPVGYELDPSFRFYHNKLNIEGKAGRHTVCYISRHVYSAYELHL